jgi:hypothetical protein
LSSPLPLSLTSPTRALSLSFSSYITRFFSALSHSLSLSLSLSTLFSLVAHPGFNNESRIERDRETEREREREREIKGKSGCDEMSETESITSGIKIFTSH